MPYGRPLCYCFGAYGQKVEIFERSLPVHLGMRVPFCPLAGEPGAVILVGRGLVGSSSEPTSLIALLILAIYTSVSFSSFETGVVSSWIVDVKADTKLWHCIQMQDLSHSDLLFLPVLFFFTNFTIGHYFSMDILIPQYHLLICLSICTFFIHCTVWFYLPWKVWKAIHCWHQCVPHYQGNRDCNVKHLNFQASFKASCTFIDCMHVIVIQFFRQCHSIWTNFILRTSSIFVSIEPLTYLVSLYLYF